MYYKEIFIDQIYLLPQSELPPLPSMSADELDELKESIQEFGILQPLIVTVIRDDKYLLQAGHNRLRIAQELGLSTIPCFVALRNDDIIDMLMGSHTDGFRRHLTPSQKNELLIWQTGLRKIKKSSPKPNTSMSSSSEDESTLLKNIINEKETMIEDLQNELEIKTKTFIENETNLKKEITEKKNQIKDLKEEYKRAIEDAEEIRYQSNKTEPSDDERITKLQKDLDDTNKRANRILEELEGARKKIEETEDQLRKEKNARKSLTAGLHARLYRQRQQDKARDKLRVAERLLEDIQRILEEVADIVRRDEVCVDTEAFVTSIKKLTESVSAIPYYPSKEKPVDTVIDQ
ncbi:MAG: ParB/RepB/Spo0J family partition protein [Syntrophaceae bacterium]